MKSQKLECEFCHIVYKSNAGGWFKKHVENCRRSYQLVEVKKKLPNCYVLIEDFKTPEEAKFQDTSQFFQDQYLFETTNQEEFKQGMQHMDQTDKQETVEESQEPIIIQPPRKGLKLKQSLLNILPTNLQRKIVGVNTILMSPAAAA